MIISSYTTNRNAICAGCQHTREDHNTGEDACYCNVTKYPTGCYAGIKNRYGTPPVCPCKAFEEADLG